METLSRAVKECTLNIIKTINAINTMNKQVNSFNKTLKNISKINSVSTCTTSTTSPNINLPSVSLSSGTTSTISTSPFSTTLYCTINPTAGGSIYSTSTTNITTTGGRWPGIAVMGSGVSLRDNIHIGQNLEFIEYNINELKDHTILHIFYEPMIFCQKIFNLIPIKLTEDTSLENFKNNVFINSRNFYNSIFDTGEPIEIEVPNEELLRLARSYLGRNPILDRKLLFHTPDKFVVNLFGKYISASRYYSSEYYSPSFNPVIKNGKTYYQSINIQFIGNFAPFKFFLANQRFNCTEEFISYINLIRLGHDTFHFLQILEDPNYAEKCANHIEVSYMRENLIHFENLFSKLNREEKIEV